MFWKYQSWIFLKNLSNSSVSPETEEQHKNDIRFWPMSIKLISVQRYIKLSENHDSSQFMNRKHFLVEVMLISDNSQSHLHAQTIKSNQTHHFSCSSWFHCFSHSSRCFSFFIDTQVSTNFVFRSSSNFASSISSFSNSLRSSIFFFARWL